jgi:hypothetical protein
MYTCHHEKVKIWFLKITSHFVLFPPYILYPPTHSPSSSYLLPFKQKGNRGHTKIERDDIHKRFGIKWRRLVPIKSSKKKQTSNQQSCLWCDIYTCVIYTHFYVGVHAYRHTSIYLHAYMYTCTYNAHTYNKNRSQDIKMRDWECPNILCVFGTHQFLCHHPASIRQNILNFIIRKWA